MPQQNQSIFEQEKDENFETGIPFLFFVKVRIRKKEGGGGEDVFAEGKWEEVFSFVEMGGGEVVEVVETRWGCEEGSGYSVCIFFIVVVVCLFVDLFVFFFCSCIYFKKQIGSIFVK